MMSPGPWKKIHVAFYLFCRIFRTLDWPFSVDGCQVMAKNLIIPVDILCGQACGESGHTNVTVTCCKSSSKTMSEVILVGQLKQWALKRRDCWHRYFPFRELWCRTLNPVHTWHVVGEGNRRTCHRAS